MRISDWSSDVCSSDLRKKRTTNTLAAIRRPVSLSEWGAAKESRAECQAIRRLLRRVEGGGRPLRRQRRAVRFAAVAFGTSGGVSSAERGVGKEMVRTCRVDWVANN